MSLRMLTLVAATAAVLAFPVAAEAARVTGSVNLRTGPSTGYAVITTLARGAYVGVGRCVPGWCLVNARGLRGWVSASYLGAGGVRYYAPLPPPRRFYAPAYPMYDYPHRHFRCGPGYGYYGGGPGYGGLGYGFYFNFGSGRHWH